MLLPPIVAIKNLLVLLDEILLTHNFIHCLKELAFYNFVHLFCYCDRDDLHREVRSKILYQYLLVLPLIRKFSLDIRNLMTLVVLVIWVWIEHFIIVCVTMRNQVSRVGYLFRKCTLFAQNAASQIVRAILEHRVVPINTILSSKGILKEILVVLRSRKARILTFWKLYMSKTFFDKTGVYKGHRCLRFVILIIQRFFYQLLTYLSLFFGFFKK